MCLSNDLLCRDFHHENKQYLPSFLKAGCAFDQTRRKRGPNSVAIAAMKYLYAYAY
jgi:hypothetical protein